MPLRSDPAIVLIHGFPGSAKDWTPVVSLLEPDHQVVVPDLLGFGPTAAQDGDLGLERQAARITALVDRLGGRPVVLVGHDVGVPIAALAAAARPDVVGALVLLAGNLVADPPLPPPMRLVRVRVIGRAIEAMIFSRPMLRSMAIFGRRSGPWPTANSRAERHAIRSIFGPALRDMAETFAPVEAATRSIEVPVRLLYGTRDPFFPITFAHRLESLFPKAELTELAGVGHFPQLEEPEAVAEAVRVQVRTLSAAQ